MPSSNSLPDEIQLLKEEIEKIKERNKRVEVDKAWETSNMRAGFIALVTFLLTFGLLMLIHADYALPKAIGASIAYWLSTESYGILKKWWIKRKNK